LDASHSENIKQGICHETLCRDTLAGRLSAICRLQRPKNQPHSATSPTNLTVDVHTASGVDVKSDKEGTTVHTPGADVDVKKK